MSDQLPCPNCGGYKWGAKMTLLDPTTGKPVINTWGCFLVVYVFAVSAILIVLQSGFTPWFLYILGIFVFAIWSSVANNKAKKSALKHYACTCNLCGYEWNWINTDPWPNVTVRPDLIAKGNQRIQEHDAIPCRGCGNTIPEGYPYCPYCGCQR